MGIGTSLSNRPPSEEDRLLDWLRRRGGATTRRMGDDAAFVDLAGDTAWTVDQQIAGVHFPADLDPAVLARRLFAVTASDLAAVGARPRLALLALAAPGDHDHRRFFTAFLRACAPWEVELAGGDLASSSRLHAVLTLAGSRLPRHRWVRRGGGRAGDRLWIAGSPGLSALGQRLVAGGARLVDRRRVELPAGLVPTELEPAAARCVRLHLQPVPRLELGIWLGSRRRAAAIDLSDGLSLDLARLCRASGTGAILEIGALAWPPSARRLADRLGEDPEVLTLGGGEDYALLAALPPKVRPPSTYRARTIGRLTMDPGLWIERRGRLRPLDPAGWDHLAPPVP